MNHAARDLPPPARLLELEIAGYKALLKVLEAESAALCRLDHAALTAAAGAKHDQVTALEQLAQLREDDLKRSGFPPSEAGILLWLRASGDPEPAPRAWRELRELARAAREANARNGRLLGRQRQHFDSALNALLRAAGVPSVYGADGRPQSAGLSRMRAAI